MWAGIAQSVQQFVADWMVRRLKSGSGETFRTVQTNPGAHLDPYTMRTSSFPWIKRPGRGVNSLPPKSSAKVNPLNPELNPICYLLALLAHHFLHVSRIRVKSLTLRLVMSYIYIYIYGAPILDVSRSHTTTQHSR